MVFVIISAAFVAPRVGAWIETSSLDNALKVISSHPVWVRGLKLSLLLLLIVTLMSHPVWVRGLKRLVIAISVYYYASHPVWVRGLKHRSL